MDHTPISILYISAKPESLEDLRNRLKAHWPHIVLTQTKETNTISSDQKIDLIIYNLSNSDYSEILSLANSKDIPLIIVTNSHDPSSLQTNGSNLIQVITNKEFKSNLLIHIINHLIERKTLVDKLSIVTKHLQNLSVRDDLTELYNKRYLDNTLETEFKKSKRYKNNVSALLIGVDGLKNINETYGHDIGDETLCEFASLLQNAIREVDTVGRLSGDEFVIIFPSTDQNSAVKVANRIKTDIHKTSFARGKLTHNPTASIGVAECKAEHATVEGWKDALREALLEAKHSGKDQICTIDEAEAKTHPQLTENTDLIYNLHGQIFTLTEEARETYFNSVFKILEKFPFYKKFVVPHSERVAFYSEKLASKAGMDRHEIESIKRASLIHDIGKIAIDKKIILKSNNLSQNEYQLLRQHPIIGIQIMGNIPFWKNELDLILHHHEWFDGRGYPDRLKSNHIPLGARILCITEAWDTMTTDQLYRPAISLDKALEEIKRNAGIQFDPELAKTFAGLIEG